MAAASLTTVPSFQASQDGSTLGRRKGLPTMSRNNFICHNSSAVNLPSPVADRTLLATTHWAASKDDEAVTDKTALAAQSLDPSPRPGQLARAAASWRRLARPSAKSSATSTAR